MKKRSKQVLISSVILAVVILFILAFISQCNHERRFMKDIAIDESIVGTPIEQGLLIVKAEVDAGKKTIPLETVLDEKDDYICAIRTSYGPMYLKVRDGKIREDIIWGDNTTIVYIIDDHVYRWSPIYKEWLRFNYTSDMFLSEKQMTRGIFSEFELLNKTLPENRACVGMELEESDFVFPAEEAVDMI